MAVLFLESQGSVLQIAPKSPQVHLMDMDARLQIETTNVPVW